METLSMTAIREEIASGVASAIDAFDWDARLGLKPDPVAPMAQDLTTLPPAFAKLGSWIAERGDKPLADGETIRISADQVEIIPPGELAQMAQGGIAGVVKQLDDVSGFDVPFGAVVFGAIPGAITGEVIDGIFPLRNADDSMNITNPVVKTAIVAGVAVFGERWIGRPAARFFAGALVLQVFVDVLPVDRFVNWAVQQLRRNGDDVQVAATAQGDLPFREASGGNSILEQLAA
ncbi:hypothetical protein LCGC14_0595250 [marine sediment metagenome]|uniref:Uncharacterized protein n=1 Tax=marine sediment metagenome TaxID=412755 RepID=A0A0F9TYG2_9ZZZZ